jgi:hypothetical protein
MPKKKAMVGWFDPGQLVATAIRVVISTLFGEFADRREAFAAANPIKDDLLDPCFDYAKRCPAGDLWLDYVADTGDGWNPTYAIARLLAEENLEVRTSEDHGAGKTSLPRARVLVMGGDQVYPTASPEEYDNRFLYPFDEAYRPEGAAQGAWPESDPPDVYAVPGNHDWYDGLRTFFHLFCRRTVKADGEAEVGRKGRMVGGRQTHQTRSYFALKLPGAWWLWGTDSQLEGYIDQPQVDFFQFVAETWMEDGSKLILCTGTPDWEYVRRDCPKKYDVLSYLERLAPAAKGKGHQLKLVLSGDSHHYARYQERGLNYVTCGGGGAFLHSTHHLPRGPVDFRTEYPRPGEAYDPKHGPYDRQFAIAVKAGTEDEEALFPDRRTSSALASGNVLFALRNWTLTLTLAVGYFFFIWLLDFNNRATGGGSLVSALAREDTLCGAARAYWKIALYSPWSASLLALTAAAYYYFADIEKPLKRLAVGGSHALLHAVLVTLITCMVARAMPPAPIDVPGWLWLLLTVSVAAGSSAVISGTLIGLYLWFCVSVFGIHWGHFSSLAVQDYKSFLRLHIGQDGKLTVYPVGLQKVPADRGWPWSRAKPPRNPPLDPHLIETPIKIPGE